MAKRSNKLALRPRLSILFTTGLSTLALTLSAHATATDAAAPASDSVNSGALEEIVVTARKKTESLLSAPVDVSALTSQAIQQLNLDDVEKISAEVPQLKLIKAYSGSGAVFSIRGVGSAPIDSGIAQSVALQIDGAQLSQGDLVNLGLFDLDEVQVLKGPQALYFGKNSSAGVVSFTSKGPTDQVEGYGKVAYEFESRQPLIEGAIGGPLTDTFGARVAVRARSESGNTFNNVPAVTDPILGVAIAPQSGRVPNEHELDGRVTLEWKPTSDFTATAKLLGQHYHDNGPDAQYSYVACAPGQKTPTVLGVPIPGGACSFQGPNLDNGYFPDIEAVGIPGVSSGAPFSDQDTTINTLRLVYTQPLYSVTSISSYAYYDFGSFGANVGPLPYFGGFNGIKFNQESEELRLATTLNGPLNFQAGAYYEANSLLNTGYRYLGPFGPDPVTGAWYTSASAVKLDGHSISPFIEASYQILSNLEFSGGARYTDDQKGISHLGNSFVHAGATFLQPEGVFTSGSFSDNNWSPEATLTYHVTQDIMTYVAYKTGFKSGTYGMPSVISNGQTADTTKMLPEKSHGEELGVKGEFLDHTLRVLGDIYTYDFSDLQTVSFNGQTVSYIYANAAESRTRGVELETEWRALPELTLDAKVGYNKANFVSYATAQCYGGQTPAQGCVGGEQNLSGAPLPHSSLVSGVAGFNYDHPVGNYHVVLYGNANYNTRFNASEINIPHAEEGGFGTYDAGVRTGPKAGPWEVALYGRNLGNKFWFTTVNDSAGGAPGDLSAPSIAGGREVWIEARYKYH
ncbi:MAG TPA: TonB-dependent receptor [Candidatus Binataceae bacterium]|nr:TonB-dependent receptor [Candidatus Binataceae bacterium]